MMRGWPIMLIAVLALSAAVAEEGQRFDIAITGPAGTAFAGECRLRSAGGERTIGLSGSVPFNRTLTGGGLTCEIGPAGGTGALSVEIRKNGGSVTRSRIAGGGVIRLSVQ
jgi:hypothetical protein